MPQFYNELNKPLLVTCHMQGHTHPKGCLYFLSDKPVISAPLNVLNVSPFSSHMSKMKRSFCHFTGEETCAAGLKSCDLNKQDLNLNLFDLNLFDARAYFPFQLTAPPI